MDTTRVTVRLLGAVFLFQAIASAVWTYLLSSLVVSDDIAATMANIADNPTQMRASIVVTMLTALGVGALGALLYTVLERQNKAIARVALVFYTIEAAILATSRIEAFALLRLSEEPIGAKNPDQLRTMAELFERSADYGDWLHMMPYAFGALLFYSLLFTSRYVPRPLAIFGLGAVALAAIGVLVELLGYAVPLVVFLPGLPFELGIGLWLIVKGIDDPDLGQPAIEPREEAKVGVL
jgi:hypothetical protein